MTRDRRGFHYALEPMRSLTEWEINDIAGEYARLNGVVQVWQQRVDGLRAALAAARGEVMAQRQSQALLDIGAQRLAHGYMAQLQQRLPPEQAQLALAQEEADACLARLHNARKFADSLDRNKETAAEEHDEKLLRQGYQQTDDNWLQRLHWRKMS